MGFLQWDELQIMTFFHVLVRVSSMLLFLPIFGDKVIPPVVKILFGLALSCVVHPVVWAAGHRLDPAVLESSTRLIFSIAGEISFGVLIGFVARWVFDAIQFAAHFAGTSMGFSMASVFDPHTETQTVAFSELLYILSAMLFLAMNGHHIYLQAILDSFKLVPLAGTKLLSISEGLGNYLILMTSEVFILGLKLSAPVVVVIFIINLTLGVLSKAVPQLNVIVISFAANIVVGLFVSLLSLPSFLNMVEFAFNTYTPEIQKFIKLFGA